MDRIAERAGREGGASLKMRRGPGLPESETSIHAKAYLHSYTKQGRFKRSMLSFARSLGTSRRPSLEAPSASRTLETSRHHVGVLSDVPRVCGGPLAAATMSALLLDHLSQLAALVVSALGLDAALDHGAAHVVPR